MRLIIKTTHSCDDHYDCKITADTDDYIVVHSTHRGTRYGTMIQVVKYYKKHIVYIEDRSFVREDKDA